MNVKNNFYYTALSLIWRLDHVSRAKTNVSSRLGWWSQRLGLGRWASRSRLGLNL